MLNPDKAGEGRNILCAFRSRWGVGRIPLRDRALLLRAFWSYEAEAPIAIAGDSAAVRQPLSEKTFHIWIAEMFSILVCKRDVRAQMGASETGHSIHLHPGKHIGDELTVGAGKGLVSVHVQEHRLALGKRRRVETHAKQKDRTYP